MYMSFIGIIAEAKEFEMIKKEILKNMKQKKMNIININKQSIDNIQNIKFEIIVVNNNLEKLKQNKIEKICNNAKYLILNTDIELKIPITLEEKINIITYGLNHKATVTISSRTEENILVALQRNIKSISGNIVEVEETDIKIKEKNSQKIYEVLIIYIILTIYETKIMEQI